MTKSDELDVWILRLAKYANTLTPYKLDDPIDPIVQDGLNEAKQAIEAIIRTEKLKLLAEVKSEWGKFGKGTNISDGEYAFLDIIEKLRSEL